MIVRMPSVDLTNRGVRWTQKNRDCRLRRDAHEDLVGSSLVAVEAKYYKGMTREWRYVLPSVVELYDPSCHQILIDTNDALGRYRVDHGQRNYWSHFENGRI